METKVQILERFKPLIDSIPDMVLIVDQDVRIFAYNEASSGIFDKENPVILKRRAGDIIHCLYSEKSDEGCGRSTFCKDCVIRNSVVKAIEGKRVIREKHKLELIRDGGVKNVYALISTSPLILEEGTFAFLVIEDINEIVELRGLIPICLRCKKVKIDSTYWVKLESYISSHLDVDFSHGFCPECLKEELKRVKGA